MKNALLASKPVSYIDDFHAFSRQNGDSFTRSYQPLDLVLRVHIYFCLKNLELSIICFYSPYFFYFALGVRQHFFSDQVDSLSFYPIFPICGLNVHNNITQNHVELQFWIFA